MVQLPIIQERTSHTETSREFRGIRRALPSPKLASPGQVTRSGEYTGAVKSASVAILLCTYNGQKYLGEQLNSIAQQTHGDWSLWASDDGSQDGTRDELLTFRDQSQTGRVTVLDGPKRGYSTNFLSLVCSDVVRGEYFAFCDQDDIWEKDKLTRALMFLRSVPAGVPALYCSRTRLMDEAGREIGYSPLFARTPSFANALVQNIGGGNTMVFNRAAQNLMRVAGPDVDIVSHDWWAYMLVTACSGRVFYDPYLSLRYRQHSDNQIGSNASWAARLRRLSIVLQGRFAGWNERNMRALDRVRHLMSPEALVVLDKFSSARRSNLFARVGGIASSGIYRQTRLGQLALYVAALLNKI